VIQVCCIASSLNRHRNSDAKADKGAESPFAPINRRGKSASDIDAIDAPDIPAQMRFISQHEPEATNGKLLHQR